MARITGTLKYVTTRPEDVKRASVRAPRAREYDGAVITTSTDYVDVVGGRLEFDAAPGPVVVTLLRARGPVEVLELIVPEGGGSLADAVGAAELADSATRSQLERLSAEAMEAVQESKAAASSAKESLGELKALESNAEGLLNSAAEAASRAEQIVGSTSWDNDVLTVNGKSSPPLTGPRGPRGEPGERGPTGERGPAGVDGSVTFDELTESQRASLVGPRGPRGPRGEPGERGP
ncbi:collagen-like triple helix repeat-containing protein, partial [Corynebacterium aurimucosum]